ncbi:MAG: polysaccharide biosynthesis C-terminal domain-containing protein [Bacillota bacterium]|nr:polysaccharide biosynthesis C-terminal domain-containing protein [Bacillota bacterium]
MTINKQIQFVKGSAILVLSNLIIKGVNFFLLPLYTKYLTPEILGVSDTISTFTSMVFPILVMGLDSAFSAFYFDKKSPIYQHKVFNTVWWTLLFVSSIPIIMAIASKYISILLFGTGEYTLLIGIALVSVSMNIWYLPFAIYVRVENRMLLFSVVNFISSLSMIMLNITFLSLLKIGVYSLILSATIVNMIQVILYLKLSGIKPKISNYDRNLSKQMLKYSLPLIPNVVATWILNMSDRYIVLYFCGEGDVGLYGIAARFGTMVSLVANGVYMAYTTYAFDKKNDSDAPKQYARILNAFTFTVLIICFTGSLFSKEIISIMTEKSYINSYLLLCPILFSQLLYGINTIVGYAMGFAKKTKYIFIATTVGAVINIALNFMLIPRFGVIAAAYTTLISFAIMTIITYIFAQKLYFVEYKIYRIIISILITLCVTIIITELSFVIKITVWIIVCVLMIMMYKQVISDYLKILKSIILKRK